MAGEVGVGLGQLSADDLSALRLAAQVMGHRAALAGLPRVSMFFERIEAEAVAEQAARGQRGERPANGFNPWRVAGLTGADRAAIVEYVGLLAGNNGLPAPVRDVARDLLAAEHLS